MRKNKNAFIIIILIISLLLTACAGHYDELIEQNNNSTYNTAEFDTYYNDIEDTSAYDAIDTAIENDINGYSTNKDIFGGIENTIYTLDILGSRAFMSNGNEVFGSKLADKLKSYEIDNGYKIDNGYSFEKQSYIVDAPTSYNIRINNDAMNVIIDNTNSRLKGFVKQNYNNMKVAVTSGLAFVDNKNRYIVISDNINVVDQAMDSINVALTIYVVNDLTNTNSIAQKSSGSNYVVIDKNLYKQLIPLISNEAYISSEIKLAEYTANNYLLTKKGTYNENAIVFTAHYDTITNLDSPSESKGIIDNGSGVSLILDILNRIDKAEYKPNYDVIFSFVDGEEIYTFTSNSGGFVLNAMLTKRYENVLNINLDCLGEIDFNTIYYGKSNSINNKLLEEYMKTNFNSEEYKLERAYEYSSDNINFLNTIFIYNMKSPYLFIHTSNDDISKIDIESLNNISKMIYKLYRYIDATDMNEMISK